MSGPYSLTRPCPKCPFRSDITPYLRTDRVRDLARALVRSEFACHQTTKPTGDGDRVATKDSIHCAGALILLEKEKLPSQMMRICERVGLYDPTTMDMTSAVYDSWDEMIQAHESQEEREREESSGSQRRRRA